MNPADRSHSPLRPVVAAVLVLVASVALLTPGGASASEPAPHAGTARFEVDFMTGMIDHHAMATEMGQLCLEKATHEELRSLCADIVASQSEEIETLQEWLSSWYGISYEPQMKPGEMKQMERLARLSGAGFDVEFMEMMSRHHAKAVRMASRCVDRAHHKDLQALCGDIVTTQTAEIQLMQGWLCDWYSICRPARR